MKTSPGLRSFDVYGIDGTRAGEGHAYRNGTCILRFFQSPSDPYIPLESYHVRELENVLGGRGFSVVWIDDPQ